MTRHGLIVRLTVPLVLMVALVLAVLLLSGRAHDAVRLADGAVAGEQRRALQLAELRSISRSLQRDALNLVTESDATELDAIRSRFDKRYRQFDVDLRALRFDRTVDTPAQFAAYRRSQRIVLDQLRLVRNAAGVSRTQALDLFRHNVRPNERRASAIADRMIDESAAASTRLSTAADLVAQRQATLLDVLSAALSLGAIAGGMAVISFTVVRPLRAIQHAMEALAAGDAAVAVPQTGRRDEIGTMARAIEVFREAACERDMLRDANNAARQAAADLRHRDALEAAQRGALEHQRQTLLSDLAGAVDDSLTEMNDKLRASAARLAHSADDVARHAAAAGSEAEQTSRSAADMTRDLAATSAATRQIADGVADLHVTAQTATDAVRVAVARSRTAATRMAGLSAYADRVGEIMDLIKNVAHKSHLLALNATIEAARVGEAGRGFGVVADEMKKLAAQTSSAANHVEHEVCAIRAVAGEGTAAIEEIGDALQQIDQNTDLVIRAVREQSLANADIGRGVAVALDQVSAVGARMASLGETAQGTRDVAGALLANADLLGADAASVDTALRDLVARLRVA